MKIDFSKVISIFAPRFQID